ncbi:MAG: ImmA/IrrE family metallo-endopeptidase [Chloroflexi bacterium]|nr:ImmA/IrrE family metallo-endopeptidase [Chloroflexota bacterium]
MASRAVKTATTLRSRFGVVSPPIADALVYLVDRRIRVRLTDLPQGISGATYAEEPAGAVIWLDTDDSPTRKRFTLFHELGHLLLHPGTFYCARGAISHPMMEREANKFAAELLMPKPWIIADVRQGQLTIPQLSARYRVSWQAMRVRLKELGLSDG